MYLKPEHHARIIANEVKDQLFRKYMKGAVEHGGHIHDLSLIELIDMAMEEAIDEFTYLYTIREKLLAQGYKKPTI